jgi:D-erythrulose 1-phosphate 3-epimerase
LFRQLIKEKDYMCERKGRQKESEDFKKNIYVNGHGSFLSWRRSALKAREPQGRREPMNFGINLSFAVKRWPEPPVWAKLVGETWGLNLVQFTYDLLDPWSPEPMRRSMAAQVRQAAQDFGVTIESAFSGLANYCYDGLLHPDPSGRRISMEWWKRALDLAAELGAAASGGPLGAMSVADAADPKRRERLYQELLDSVEQLSRAAAAAGLKRLLVECTPLAREVPFTVEQAQKFMTDLEGRCDVPVQLLIDVGHALYQPLYGPKANMTDWLRGLGRHIGSFHLQNTDFQSDSHWGWPDSRGLFDVASFAQDVRDSGLEDVAAHLEVFYPFELADEKVLASIASSVLHCQQKYCGERLEKELPV